MEGQDLLLEAVDKAQETAASPQTAVPGEAAINIDVEEPQRKQLGKKRLN